MSRQKVHYEIITQHPNECDTMGDSVLACGMESCDLLSQDAAKVTCANCLRAMKKYYTPSKVKGTP